MVYFSLPHVLCVSAVFHTGLTSLIQAQLTTTGRAGDQVCLYCKLTEPRDVHQVTWQKILLNGEKNVATFNKYFGPRVDPVFRGKVAFKDAGLQNSSIVIMGVTDQDEGCYHCLFNTYPDGALTGKTCLQVYKLFGPSMHLRESNSTEEVIVSCSATGRPAPTVTITASQRDLFILHNESVSFTNNDSTVTVNKTAVLSRRHNNTVQVSCAAQVLSVPQKEEFMMIPEVRVQPTVGGSEEESEVNSSGHSGDLIVALVTVLLVCVCVVAVTFFHCKQKNQHRALQSVFEVNETDLESIRSPHETQASAEDTSSVRKRTSPVKNQESKNITPPPSSVRRLSFEYEQQGL